MIMPKLKLITFCCFLASNTQHGQPFLEPDLSDLKVKDYTNLPADVPKEV